MSNSQLPYHHITLKSGVEVDFLGPPLEFGPLPTLFYFALSSQDSLCLDPFNQPAKYLSLLPMRIFSLTLPGHENKLPPTQALNIWAKEISEGHDIIATFVEKTQHALRDLISGGYIIQDKLAVAGLSRGAFIATHVAAKIPEFQTLLGFAPLTQLSFAKEFQDIAHDPLVQSLNLEHLVDNLTERAVRFYIGNIDTRVGTRRCFDFIEKLSQTAYDKKIRSPSTELIISPSIGQHGHGTSKTIFHQGAQWIAETLGAIDVL